MIGDRKNPPAPSVDLAMIEAFRGAATSIISDNLSRLPGAVDLRPCHRGGKLVGTAVSVRTRSGDNLAIHQALTITRPGDVLVIDGGGDTSRALVGEIMKVIAETAGAAGLVVHRGSRNGGALRAPDVPCYGQG